MLTHAGLDIEVDGKIYTFSSLTLEDLDWLELKFRARMLEVGRMSVPANCSPEETEKYMAPVFDRVFSFNINDSFDQLFTPTGVTWLLYRLLVKKHPDIKLSDISPWVTNPAILNRVLPQLKLLFPQINGAGAEPGPGSSKRAAKKKR